MDPFFLILSLCNNHVRPQYRNALVLLCETHEDMFVWPGGGFIFQCWHLFSAFFPPHLLLQLLFFCYYFFSQFPFFFMIENFHSFYFVFQKICFFAIRVVFLTSGAFNKLRSVFYVAVTPRSSVSFNGFMLMTKKGKGAQRPQFGGSKTGFSLVESSLRKT